MNMGHPEAINQSSRKVNPLENDPSKTLLDGNGHDLPKVMDLNSKGLCLFPALDSQSFLHCVTHLFLDRNKLTFIPCGLPKLLLNLQVLNLDDNVIVELPGDICDFSFLQELFICKNKLTSLPQSLYQLKRLQILKVSCNKLKALHSEIGQHEYLEILDVSENALKRFPATLGLLKNLSVMNASKNELVYIPQTIHFLKSLRVLNLSDNQLETVPDSFSLLGNLHDIDLSKNQISSLWPRCASTHCLERIILDSNFITALPSWFSQLDNVHEICVARNNLRCSNSLPMDFGTRLQKLTKLDLRGNLIEILPPSLGCLSGLQTLFLGTSMENSMGTNTFVNGNWLSALPKNFVDLKSLISLTLEENQLTLLPKNFGCLVLLKELHIGGNLLTSLPKSFCRLESLEKCQLSRNKLRSLPVDFGYLDKMKELYLDSNKLKTLPISMKNCVQLEVLDLRGNRFAEAPCSVLDVLTQLKDLKVFEPLQDDDCAEVDVSNHCMFYSEDEGDDHDLSFEMDSNDDEDRSTSSGSSLRQLIPVEDDEETWDDDFDVPRTEEAVTVSEKGTSDIEYGQFDLDEEESIGHNKDGQSRLSFDVYGNASQRIDLSISQHRMLPYLLHQPKQVRRQLEACQEEDDQFDDV